MSYLFENARDAYLALKALGKTPAGLPATQTLDKYFDIASTDPYTGALKPHQTSCPAPVAMGADCYSCPRCKIQWDKAEEKPECNEKGTR